jgi:hypothetical protein
MKIAGRQNLPAGDFEMCDAVAMSGLNAGSLRVIAAAVIGAATTGALDQVPRTADFVQFGKLVAALDGVQGLVPVFVHVAAQVEVGHVQVSLKRGLRFRLPSFVVRGTLCPLYRQ